MDVSFRGNYQMGEVGDFLYKITISESMLQSLWKGAHQRAMGLLNKQV
jgi:hypothetical protein